MKKLFFVAIDDDATKEQRDSFTALLRDLAHVGFWHHTIHAWLIIDTTGELSCSKLRTQLTELMPTVTVIAIQVTPVNWSAFAPKRSFEWLHKHLDSGINGHE